MILMIKLPDDISIHVFKGAKLMDIYSSTTGFPRLDKEWARNRNRDIELKIEELREILNYNGTKLRPGRVEEIRDEIENLLEERDDITFKFGLAGKRFDSEYEERVERKNEDASGVDRDGDICEDTLYDKLINSGIPMSVIEEKPEVNGESRFRFITEEMVTLYSKKNADYGDAFTQSLDEDGLLVSKIRIKDKLNRFSQLIDNDALVNDESMRDTLIDLANYTVMTLMWLDENE